MEKQLLENINSKTINILNEICQIEDLLHLMQKEINQIDKNELLTQNIIYKIDNISHKLDDLNAISLTVLSEMQMAIHNKPEIKNNKSKTANEMLFYSDDEIDILENSQHDMSLSAISNRQEFCK